MFFPPTLDTVVTSFHIFIAVLQRSVHPGLSFRETTPRAGGGTEDELRGAEKPRVVSWSNTQTGNTLSYVCVRAHTLTLPRKA